MKALLIEPPRWNEWPMLRADRCSRPAFNCVDGAPFPYWLASTAAYLRQHGVEIDFLDANALDLSWEDVRSHVLKSVPDVVIFTGANCSIDWDLHTAMVVKKANPKIKTAIYEPLLSPQRPEEIFSECPALDVIFLSEPENIALSFCKDGFNASGIAYRDPKKGIVRNKIEPLDIADLPMPVYDLLPMEKYDEVTMRMSRGCPYMCNFCTIGSITDPNSGFYYEKRLRYRNTDNVVEELKYLESIGYADEISFGDETFTLNRQKIVDFCNQIRQQNIKVRFRIQTRVDKIDEELLQLLKTAGCYHMGYGVESGDESVLSMMKKDTHVDQIKNAFALTRKVGIKTTSLNIVGTIGETKETVQKTINLNKELLPDSVQFSTATPLIGTGFWDYCKKNNLMLYDEKIVERAIVGTHAYIEYPHLRRQELYDLVRKGLQEINMAYLKYKLHRSIPQQLRSYVRRARTAYRIMRMPKTEFPGKTVINV